MKSFLQHPATLVTMMKQTSPQSLTRTCLTDPLHPLVSRVWATVPKAPYTALFVCRGSTAWSKASSSIAASSESPRGGPLCHVPRVEVVSVTGPSRLEGGV